MRRYKLLVIGLAMVAAGGFLIFLNPQALPLWFTWLAGPLLWYLGIAISIAGIACAFFLPHSAEAEQKVIRRQRQEEGNVLLQMRSFDRGPSPAVLSREVPSMGAFIL